VQYGSTSKRAEAQLGNSPHLNRGSLLVLVVQGPFTWSNNGGTCRKFQHSSITALANEFVRYFVFESKISVAGADRNIGFYGAHT
jgi:hypothetical protein